MIEEGKLNCNAHEELGISLPVDANPKDRHHGPIWPRVA